MDTSTADLQPPYLCLQDAGSPLYHDAHGEREESVVLGASSLHWCWCHFGPYLP